MQQKFLCGDNYTFDFNLRLYSGQITTSGPAYERAYKSVYEQTVKFYKTYCENSDPDNGFGFLHRAQDGCNSSCQTQKELENFPAFIKDCKFIWQIDFWHKSDHLGGYAKGLENCSASGMTEKDQSKHAVK